MLGFYIVHSCEDDPERTTDSTEYKLGRIICDDVYIQLPWLSLDCFMPL